MLKKERKKLNIDFIEYESLHGLCKDLQPEMMDLSGRRWR